MMFRGSFLAVMVLAMAVTGGAASSQTAAPADDAPLIDLRTVLEAPAETQSEGETAPAVEPETLAVENGLDFVAPEDLTIPQFTRSGTDGSANAELGLYDTVLLPLRANNPTLDGIVRLTGEVQSEDFFIDLPLTVATRDVVLSYRIAINVLPEQSRLHVRVNGIDLPPIVPDAFEGFEQIRVPGTLLTDGRNQITVTVNHGHRIFCGPDATFAVWTEIDTNTSGVELSRAEIPVNAVGLDMALRAQLALTGTLPVRMANPDDLVFIDRLTPQLAGLRDAVSLNLIPIPLYGVRNEGAPEISRITILPGAAPGAMIRRGAGGAIVLVVTSGLDGELPDLTELLPQPLPIKNIPPLKPGVVTTLRDLEFTKTEAYNRYSEQEITFGLPSDWLTLASQKAQLRLVYSFAPGLPDGAIMLVKVNEETIQLLPLDRDGGRAIPTLDINFNARLLRPGANALTFVAIVPGDPPNMSCPPMAGPMMTIGAQSTLIAPPSPRMRLADLADPLVSMRPDQIRSISESTDTETAGTLAKLLSSSMRPVQDTSRYEEASLTVINGFALDGLDLTDLEVGRREILRLFPTSRVAPVPEAAETDAAGTTEEPPRPGLFRRIGMVISHYAHGFARLAVPGDGSLTTWLSGRNASAVLFIPEDENPRDLWLMIGPQSDPRRIADVMARARLSAQGPRGRLSVLTPEGKWESWHTTRTAPVLEEPLTIANFRNVAGNYASWSPLYFGALLLVLTLVSVCLALVYAITTRGRRK